MKDIMFFLLMTFGYIPFPTQTGKLLHCCILSFIKIYFINTKERRIIFNSYTEYFRAMSRAEAATPTLLLEINILLLLPL